MVNKYNKIIIYPLLMLLMIAASACSKQDNLAEYRGKWVIVNYWATWCQPCLTELPELNQLYLKHQDKIMVLGVNFDGLSPAETSQFVQSMQLQFPLLSHFPIEKFGEVQIPSLPITFLISPQGKLVETLHGPQTADTLLKATGVKP